MKRPQLLRGPNVSLSLPIREDFEDLSLWNDPIYREFGSTPRFVVVDDPDTRLKSIRDAWKRGEEYFSITKEDEFIGFLYMKRFIDGKELALSLLRERGRGYGKEAVMLGLVWEFAISGAPVVVLWVSSFNEIAKKTYESAGMKRICRIPRLLRYAEDYVDMEMFIAERREWLKEHRPFVYKVLEDSGYDPKILLRDVKG